MIALLVVVLIGFPAVMAYHFKRVERRPACGKLHLEPEGGGSYTVIVGMSLLGTISRTKDGNWRARAGSIYAKRRKEVGTFHLAARAIAALEAEYPR